LNRKSLPFRPLLLFYSLPRPPVALSELPAAWAEASRIFNAPKSNHCFETFRVINHSELSGIQSFLLPGLKQAASRFPFRQWMAPRDKKGIGFLGVVAIIVSKSN